MMYSLDEIGLVPSVLSDVKHRGDVNPYINGKLPIFVAPMTCILNANNIEEFAKSKVIPILPVLSGGLELRKQLPTGGEWEGWTALTLYEFKHLFNACNAPEDKKHYVLIDVANGHMKELFSCVRDAKQEYGDGLTVMIGNIANPETYIECCKARVDYVRVGIGGGSGCTTSVQTGIHTSMSYILEGIAKAKAFMSLKLAEPITFRTKVIADGGINTISRAIKALALGADYIMMGRCFAECEEATVNTLRYYNISSTDKAEYQRQHLYYGQSSKEGQLDRFGEIKSNPEGTSRWIPVTTNLAEFTEKFEAALRSAMSYCNTHTLDEFIGNVKYEVMSPMEFKAFNK